MTTATSTMAGHLDDAASISYVTPAEAQQLAAGALQRMLALLDTLVEEDWRKPTACTEWNVRDMVAHQAGAYASGRGYGEMIRQYSAAARFWKLPEDEINRRQLAERANRSPGQLIAEIRGDADKAIENWAYGFRLLKPLGIPHPIAGWLSMRHLMLVVHSRDTWIHRLDISRATGRPFEQTAGHDGRIVALVVRDLAAALAPKLGARAIVLDLAGVAGGRWRIGRGEPPVTVRMDALDFNIYASGRFTYEEALHRSEITGDRQLGELALRNFAVLY